MSTTGNTFGDGAFHGLTSPDHLDLIPVSALQHWCFCPRQCALIHSEQVFAENIFTQRGRALHSLVDTPGVEVRDGLRIVRSLPIWSESMGLIGKADVVEFEPDGTPYPVEYKHGAMHKARRIVACDELQLAAQAVCIEEMTKRAVPEGALFYGASRRRRIVSITSELRKAVREAATSVRRLLAGNELPRPENDERCRRCSLYEICQPAAISHLHAHLVQLRASLFDPEL